MRDDRNRWTPQTDHAKVLEVGGVSLQEVPLTRQVMISGVSVRADQAPVVGWPDVATGESYTLSLRRDRVLQVNESKMAEGWDAKLQQAVSDVTHGFRVFDLRGPNALAALQRGAEITLAAPSLSVARLLFGLSCFVYRIDRETDFRIHVARGHGEALHANLITAMRAAADHTG